MIYKKKWKRKCLEEGLNVRDLSHVEFKCTKKVACREL